MNTKGELSKERARAIKALEQRLELLAGACAELEKLVYDSFMTAS